MSTLLDRTRMALRIAGVIPNRKLGQNFMIDPEVIDEIVEVGDLREEDTVLEIGAGTGNLTCALATNAGKVVAIEYDKRLADYLIKHIASEYDNVEIIQGDALQVKFPPYNKVISNPPYNISSEIILKLIDCGFEICVLTLQEEFAYRLIASPGMKEYSRISVKVQLFAETEGLFIVPKRCFYPVPEVDSVCVLISPKRDPMEIYSETILDLVLKSAFNQRRKKLRNSLMGILKLLDIDKGALKTFISHLPETILDQRAEDLTPTQYVYIANSLYKFWYKGERE